MQMHPSLNTRFLCFVMLMLLSMAGNELSAQDLISPATDAPRYHLSNPRFENDRFGRRNFVVNYTRTQAGTLDPTPTIQAEGKTRSGSLRVVGTSISKTSGEVRISTIMRSTGDIELYFLIEGAYGKMLVSNVVRNGNPGDKTQSRSWTAEEEKAYQRAKLSKTPPENLPSGYIAVQRETKLLPGMPVKAGFYAEWVDATVVRAETENQVLIKLAPRNGLVTLNREKWLAIEEETLKQGAANPDQFSTNIRALPGSKLIIPKNAERLPVDLELPVGTPLLYDYRIMWRDVYVVKADDKEIKLRYKGYKSNWDETKPRGKFLIGAETLKRLKDPDAVAKFATNIETEAFPAKDSGSFSARSLRVTDYPITLELPKDSQVVPEDLVLTPGTPLAAVWARKWNALSVMSESSSGTVDIRFDRHKTEYTMKRSQLAIQNKTVEKLKRSRPEKKEEQETVRHTASELAKTLRVWTDVTGKYKFEAYYVSHTETKLTLKTAAGREINMPLRTIGTADRDLLSSIVSESENPFK